MKNWLVFLFLFSPFLSWGQELEEFGKPLSEISMRDLDLVSLDTKDQIFISNSRGDIFQYNAKGERLNLFSPTRQGRLHQLEAAWTVNIFSFSADLQAYRILDRFLNLLSEKGFFQTEVQLAKAATLGNNNIIWVWDESDLNLKILDYRRNLITQSQPLNLILNLENLNVVEIREFKNRLFMNVKNEGVFLFDNQGNFLKKINLKTDQRLSFYKEHLFWLEEGKIKAISLLNQEVREMAKSPNSRGLQIQMGQEIITLISKDKITVYPFPEKIKNLN
ncbi:hypothetical protein V8V91_22490 [Algoriphagus halophilus]|uniref:hypothetical protein n=1 Tax=Algoriphagus halophilus TaxID=226505 RepID=UPI00358E25B2